MYSYQNITNRNEFIEKFRQDQGLTPTAKSKQLPSDSRINNSRVASSNTSLNKSVSHARGNLEGRWDYLYQLEKLKQSKLEEQRRLQEQQLFEKDITECTFSPKLNTNKSTSNLRSKNHLYNFNGNMPLQTNENDDSKHVDCLLNRQQQWNYKKNMKIEKIKQNQNLNDVKECVFKPKLNSPDKIKRIDIGEPTKNLVVDPESYVTYVNRLHKQRDNLDQINKREKSLPGTGNIWKNKVTKPQQVNLGIGGIVNKSNIKSLNKPITPAKFSNIKRNYKVGEGKYEKDNKRSVVDLIYSQRGEETKFDELETRSKQGIKFDGKIEFNYALKNLHNELHSLDLLGYES